MMKKKNKVKKAKPKVVKKVAKKTPVVSKAKVKVAKVVVKSGKDKKIVLKPKTNEIKTVYLALGSNVGDREEYIEQAITLLRETPGIKVVRRASNYETEAEGKRNQAAFINSAVEITTNLAPEKLLEITQSMEDTLGRERGVEWGPRTIDIDILLFGRDVISTDDLTVPHPLMHERMFVLEPLKEIAPHVIHPVLERTITELYEDRKLEVKEKYDDELPGFREIKRGISDDYERW